MVFVCPRGMVSAWAQDRAHPTSLTWLRSMPDSIELDCLAPDLTQTVLDILTEKI
jgi:hypothetical protein